MKILKLSNSSAKAKHGYRLKVGKKVASEPATRNLEAVTQFNRAPSLCEGMADFMGRISIIMPAYNEGSRVFKSIEVTAKVLEQAQCDYEIILVDDGSSDNTHLEALRAHVKNRFVKVVKVPTNSGKGHAIMQGFGEVTGDVVVFLDADLDLHPRQICSLFDDLVAHSADVVIGSKRHPESKLDYPWYRKIMSNIYFILIKLLFDLPVKDTQTGIKIFRYEVLRDVFPRLLVKKYAFDLELLVNAHFLGYKIEEAPITLRFQGKYGRIRTKEIFHTILDTLRIYYRLRANKVYDVNKEPEFAEP